MSTPIDFTSTAMRRPEILGRTLASFVSNLHGVDWKGSRLFLNVDPLPIQGNSWAVVRTAEGASGTVIPHFPTEPNFPAAVKWCWSQPTTEYFFHLEDDWILDTPVDIGDLISRLEKDPCLSCVNLRAYNFSHPLDRICLSPGLHRTAHAKVMAGRMTTDYNPEKQLRPTLWEGKPNPGGGKAEGFYGMQFPDARVVYDIGREWLSEHGGGYVRKDGFFTKWEKA